MARIQFILKTREALYTDETANSYERDPVSGLQYLSSGLLNSAHFVEQMLAARLGHITDLSHAVNNNCIDRQITVFKPDICVIEAYWVVPEKFTILKKLHPKVIWVIRNHSALPFAANEGVVMDWTLRYMDYENVLSCSNDLRTDAEMRAIIAAYKPKWSNKKLNETVHYLPNYYPLDFTPHCPLPESNTLNISCFGALRPLKNHLMQAVAAIKLARKLGKKLRFHINGTRIEMKGEPIQRNLSKMFGLLPDYELVEHSWLAHDKFIALLRQMDLAMQVSFTETFNIVTADAVVNGVPVITSPDIVWIDSQFHADPNSSDQMVTVMERTLAMAKQNAHWQQNMFGLRVFDEASVKIWNKFIKSHTS